MQIGGGDRAAREPAVGIAAGCAVIKVDGACFKFAGSSGIPQVAGGQGVAEFLRGGFRLKVQALVGGDVTRTIQTHDGGSVHACNKREARGLPGVGEDEVVTDRAVGGVAALWVVVVGIHDGQRIVGFEGGL